MRRFVTLLAFLLLASGVLVAQCNGGGNGNGNNGNGYGNNGNGNGNNNGNAWGCPGWPGWLIQHLENGGQVPRLVALAVIWEARSWGQQNFGLNYGQLVARYVQGQLTVEYMSVSPPALLFRVAYGGGNIVVILEAI